MKFTSLLLTLLLVACNTATKTAETSSGNINADAPYKWTTAFPKTLRVSDQFSSDEDSALRLMSTAWSTAVSNKKTFFQYGSDTPEKSNGVTNMDSLYDSIMGVYKCTDWPSSLPGSALAVTQIFGRRYNVGDSDEFVAIEHADIIVNYDFYDFDTANSGSGYDFRTVVLHEMGHFLGLSHKPSSSNRSLSVMYPSIDSNEDKRAPLAQDIADISNRYNLGTGATSSAVNQRYQIKATDAGSPVRILIELHADGECVHKENGVIVKRH